MQFFIKSLDSLFKIMEYLKSQCDILECITLLHRLKGYVLRINLKKPIKGHQLIELKSAIQDLTIPYDPSVIELVAIVGLDNQRTRAEILESNQVFVVYHGVVTAEQMDDLMQRLLQKIERSEPESLTTKHHFLP